MAARRGYLDNALPSVINAPREPLRARVSSRPSLISPRARGVSTIQLPADGVRSARARVSTSSDRRRGLAPVQGRERRDLLDDRHGTRSMGTRQPRPARCPGHAGEPTLSDAPPNRPLHNAHRIVLKRTLGMKGGHARHLTARKPCVALLGSRSSVRQDRDAPIRLITLPKMRKLAQPRPGHRIREQTRPPSERG